MSLLLQFKQENFIKNLMHFQGEMVNFFLKNKALRIESVNVLKTLPYTGRSPTWAWWVTYTGRDPPSITIIN